MEPEVRLEDLRELGDVRIEPTRTLEPRRVADAEIAEPVRVLLGEGNDATGSEPNPFEKEAGLTQVRVGREPIPERTGLRPGSDLRIMEQSRVPPEHLPYRGGMAGEIGGLPASAATRVMGQESRVFYSW